MSISATELREKQNSPGPSKSRYVWMAIGALVIGIVIYAIVSGRPGGEKAPPKESVTSSREALGKLYAEAQKDLKNKKLPEAAIKFKQLDNMDPGYKDAAKQAEAAAAELYDEALEDIKKGDYDAAKDKLDTVKKVNPRNKNVDKKLDEIKDKTGGSTPAPGDSSPPPEGGGARAIPADATPESLLVTEISGYENVENGWIDEPFKAGSTFIPTSAEVRAQIDRVLWTITKLDTDAAADEALASTKDAWPLDPQDMTINGHDAYSGVYNFENATEFYKLRQMATIAWTRDNWLFMIEVLPTGTPDSTYKKGIARDIAIQLGY